LSFLLVHYDAELAVGREQAETIAKQERERLTQALLLVQAVTQIPRRIGSEASGADLAADKRRARRVAFALKQSLEAWGGPTAGKWDLSQEAAQLDWDSWLGEHKVKLNNRITYVSTWGVKRNHERWAKSAVVKLNNEARWLAYALR
jgi:hypothetical protein